MDITLEFGTSDADLAVTARGLATREEWETFYRRLPEQPGFRPGMRILLDFWELDISQLSEEDAAAIGRALRAEEPRYGPVSLGVFAPGSSLLGLTRLAAAAGGFEQIEVVISDDYDEVVAWLAKQPAIE